jgi:hypothetical protein
MTTLHRRPAAFQAHRLPPATRLVGLAALAHALDVQVPVRHPACVSDGHVRGSVSGQGPWRVFDRRYDPGDDACAHLSFSLRHEDLDLPVLKRILEALPSATVRDFVAAAPTGMGHRRIWYWYEHLLGRRLDLPDAPKVAAVDLLDPAWHFVVPGTLSTRHRVRDNTLGTPAFCPTIRRTPALEAFVTRGLAERAKAELGQVSAEMIMRAASFMLLADSRASFAIERERPPRTKLERWGRAVLEAGQRPLDLAEIERLHAILIADDRFVTLGLRQDAVFLGERDRHGEPLPEFIGASPADLPALVAGLLASNDRIAAGGLDPVLQAAVVAFGFVFVHPLEDGNGRLHRCLIHQVLAERGFAPPGIVFPVSSVMAERIATYRETLRAHTGPLMPYIPWRPTPSGNVEVLADTADMYRYFDATACAEFLYACVARTIDVDMPRELDYLRRHDRAMREVMNRVAFSDRLAQDFIQLVRQHGGTLPKRRREGVFAKLTPAELADLEGIVRGAFEGGSEEPGAP